MKDCSETPDGKEPTSESTGTGYKFYCKHPATGEIVEVKPLTKYEALKLKYNNEHEENIRLLRRVASQKSENEILQRKVHDLSYKLSKSYRECDKFKGKLRQLHELSKCTD